MSLIPGPVRYIHERELQRLVAARCRELGLLHFHVPNSRGTGPSMNRGWPDCTILSLRGLIFRELKGQSGQLTPAQRAVGYAMVRAGANFRVWRPQHWFDGMIERELQELCPPGDV